MNQEEIVLTMIRGVIAGLPEEQQRKISECAEKIRTLVAEYGDDGTVAMGLVGAELQTKV